MPGMNAIVIGLPAAKANRVIIAGNKPTTPNAAAPFRMPRRDADGPGAPDTNFSTICCSSPIETAGPALFLGYLIARYGVATCKNSQCGPVTVQRAEEAPWPCLAMTRSILAVNIDYCRGRQPKRLRLKIAIERPVRAASQSGRTFDVPRDRRALLQQCPEFCPSRRSRVGRSCLPHDKPCTMPRGPGIIGPGARPR